MCVGCLVTEERFLLLYSHNAYGSSVIGSDRNLLSLGPFISIHFMRGNKLLVRVIMLPS